MAGPSSIAPAIFYQDPMRALDWLQKAFGFELSMLITDAEGRLGHSQVTWGDGYIMVGTEWDDDLRSPASVGGKNTQTVHIRLAPDDGDIDAHCERARAAGAEIIQEPSTQFYGDRTYRCRDPEGHVWTFAQPRVTVTRAEAEAASGLTIQAPDWE